MEISYRYNIYLENENHDGLDFGDLLEKSLVLIRPCKFLADFIRHEETDLIKKDTRPSRKVSTSPQKVSSSPILPSLSHPRLRPPNSKLCKGLYKKSYLGPESMRHEVKKSG